MTLEILFSFLTLSVLEIVLGIDNLIFIALVVQKLPKEFANKARHIGLVLALGMRVLMLMGIAWIISLTDPIFTVVETGFSVKDLLLLAGGLFLIVKSTLEMHADIMEKEEEEKVVKASRHFAAAVIQIVFIDIIFSFDSVITAVGMTTNIPVIVAAMVVAMIVMMIASGHIAQFLKDHPTFKMLALSFILMIGTVLLAEALHFHVPRGYIYFAFTFSILVESMNTVVRAKRSKK